MTNAEHLIENALCSIERNEPALWFFQSEHNIEMAKQLNIDLKNVYEMATYVFYTYVPEMELKDE